VLDKVGATFQIFPILDVDESITPRKKKKGGFLSTKDTGHQRAIAICQKKKERGIASNEGGNRRPLKSLDGGGAQSILCQ